MRAIFVLPVLIGLSLLAGSLLFFRRDRLDPRYFAIAIVLSGLVAVSPLIHLSLKTIKDLLGFTFSFVLGFGLAILLLIALMIYVILTLGTLRNETEAMWQEIALLRAEYETAPEDSELDVEDHHQGSSSSE